MLSLFCLGLASCGYTLQNSRSPLLDKEGIHRIFIESPYNKTYKVGIESLVYNALVKNLSSHQTLKLVQSKEEADAVLKEVVTVAEYAGTGAQGFIYQGAGINTEYRAVLTCLFTLERSVVPPGKKKVFWTSTFSRTHPFQAGNRDPNGGVPNNGATAGLINESEFDRALQVMATNMMDDVHESMLAIF